MFATINFINNFLEEWRKKYNVKKEFEYPKYIIYSNPKLPSRSRHIYFNEESPLPILIEDIKKLNNFNVDFIVIPCNTINFYYDDLQKNSKVKILNMVDITVKYLKSKNIKNILIIGTEGIYKTKLFDKYGLENTIYHDDLQSIRTVIDGVKNNIDNDILIKMFKKILCKDKYNLLCCTELSLLYNNNKNILKKYKIVDSQQILIQSIIYGNKTQ